MSKVEIPVMKKRVGLGRGLGALLQDSDDVNSNYNTPNRPVEQSSPPFEIRTNQFYE